METTYVDFLRLCKILEEEQLTNDKRDWYDAQTCYELFCLPYRVWGKQPPTTVGIKSFLLSFKMAEQEPKILNAAPGDEVDEEKYLQEVENYSRVQMAMWGAVTGAGFPNAENDAQPLLTKMPPGLTPPRDFGPGALSSATSQAGPAEVTMNQPPPGFVPRGKGRKRNRGH